MGKKKKKESVQNTLLRCDTSDWNICKGSKKKKEKTFSLSWAGVERNVAARGITQEVRAWKRLGVEDMLLL